MPTRKELLNSLEPDFTGTVIWTSPEGEMLLKQKIKAVLDKRKEELTKLGETAKDDIDLPENLEFKEIRVRLMFVLPRELADLKEKRLQMLMFQEATWFKQHDFQTITLGTRVTIVSSDYGEETFDLLGPIEALYSTPDRPVTVISYEAPLGKLLIGKKIGDTVNPAKDINFMIKNIEQVLKPSGKNG